VMTTQDENAVLSALRQGLPEVLPGYLPKQRWFGGKARTIQSAEVPDIIPLRSESGDAYLILCRVRYADGDNAVYALPLLQISSQRETSLREGERPIPSIRVLGPGQDGSLTFCDALWNQDFAAWLLDSIAQGKTFKGHVGEVSGSPTRAFAKLRGDPSRPIGSSVLGVEQSNTSVRFQDRLILKLFRHIETGVNPDVEICTFLTERTRYSHFPAVAGSLVYRAPGQEPANFAVLQAFIPNQGDAWITTLRALEEYFDRTGALGRETVLPAKPLIELATEEAPDSVRDQIGKSFEAARLLGKRTAELHVALASSSDDAAFSPEPFTDVYLRGLCDLMLDLSRNVFGLLRQRLGQLPPETGESAAAVVEREAEVQAQFRRVLESSIATSRIRIHGDYHLGQVLNTGADFVIIDFEGEPARSLLERRVKRSPLRDVAGMLRSFHYAAHTAMLRQVERAPAGVSRGDLQARARYWQTWVSSAFLRGYFQAAGSAIFLPQNTQELTTFLQAYLLDKAVYELGYELNNRPDWVKIPLAGILQVLDGHGAAGRSGRAR